MLVEGFGRGLPAEDLPGSVVERVLDREEFLKTPTGEVGSLREVLAEQPVGVLFGAGAYRGELFGPEVPGSAHARNCLGWPPGPSCRAARGSAHLRNQLNRRRKS